MPRSASPPISSQWPTVAVISGIVLQAVFAVAGLTPNRDVTVAGQANFAVNHTFLLNLVAIAVAAALVLLRCRATARAAP